MTLVLLLYTINSKSLNKKPLKEAMWCTGIFIFYLIYSLIRQINVPAASLIDFQQQVRPYVVFYCSWMLAPQFSKSQQKWILSVFLLTLATYTILKLGTIGSTENVVLGSLSMSAGLVYYLFTEPTKRNRNIAILIVLFGLLCGKFKYFGECVAFIAVVTLLKRKLKLDPIRLLIQASLLGSVIIFFTWERFDGYFVSGMDNEQLARPMMYKTAPKVIADYFPFGPGLATFGTSASAKDYYSPLYYKYSLDKIWGMSPSDRGAFNADSFYTSLAQFGFVGIMLFLVFWKQRLKNLNRIIDVRAYRIALLAMLCLGLESIADTSYLSGRGMVYFMLLGLCLNMTTKNIQKKQLYEKE